MLDPMLRYNVLCRWFDAHGSWLHWMREFKTIAATAE